MTPADYEFLRTFLKDRSGLVLSNDKQYLIESRLMPGVEQRSGCQVEDAFGARGWR